MAILYAFHRLVYNKTSMFTQKELEESLCFGSRTPHHVISTVLSNMLSSTKELNKLNDLQQEWKLKRSTWSEWTIGLAKKGILHLSHVNKLHDP